MKSNPIAFGHFKYFFLFLFAISLTLPSCEREGDDDDEYEEYEEDDDDDDEKNIISLTACLEAQLIMEDDRVNVENFSAAEVPMTIREFIATEIPSSYIETVKTFTTNSDVRYYEVLLKGDTKLLFNSALEFICKQ